MMEVRTYTVKIEPCEEGGYWAYFPAVPGCHTQGETLEEVLAMAKDALACYLEWLQDEGRPLPVEARALRQVGFEVPVSASLAR